MANKKPEHARDRGKNRVRESSPPATKPNKQSLAKKYRGFVDTLPPSEKRYVVAFSGLVLMGLGILCMMLVQAVLAFFGTHFNPSGIELALLFAATFFMATPMVGDANDAYAKVEEIPLMKGVAALLGVAIATTCVGHAYQVIGRAIQAPADDMGFATTLVAILNGPATLFETRWVWIALAVLGGAFF